MGFECIPTLEALSFFYANKTCSRCRYKTHPQFCTETHNEQSVLWSFLRTPLIQRNHDMSNLVSKCESPGHHNMPPKSENVFMGVPEKGAVTLDICLEPPPPSRHRSSYQGCRRGSRRGKSRESLRKSGLYFKVTMKVQIWGLGLSDCGYI